MIEDIAASNVQFLLLLKWFHVIHVKNHQNKKPALSLSQILDCYKLKVLEYD